MLSFVVDSNYGITDGISFAPLELYVDSETMEAVIVNTALNGVYADNATERYSSMEEAALHRDFVKRWVG